MEEVRRLRLEKGWNQTELAYHAKLAPSVISLLETGKREPNASTLRKLAEALGVTIPDLFRESGSSKAQAPPPPENGERGSKKTVDALAVLLEYKVRWGQALIDDLKSSGDEFPLVSSGEFSRESWAVRTIHDAQPPEVREAPRVRAARAKLEEVESQLEPLERQWFGPTALDPDQWDERDRFSRKRAEEHRLLSGETGQPEDAPRYAGPGA